MKIFRLIILLSAVLLPLQICAQKRGRVSHNNFTFGIGGGYRINFMKFTKTDPSFFWTVPDYRNDFVVSGFVYKEFQESGHFALRAQFSYLRRGARYVFYRLKDDYYGYNLYAKCADFRLPIIFNFTEYRSDRLQPYAYLTPIFSMVTGGHIASSYDAKTPSINLTKANIAEYYFGIGAALGLRYNINVKRRNFFFGIEAMYDHGLTDTYSQKEKKGDVNNVGKIIDYEHDPLKGKRLLKGLEFQAIVGIPIGKNKDKNDLKGESKTTKKDNQSQNKTTANTDKPKAVEEKDSENKQDNVITDNNDNVKTENLVEKTNEIPAVTIDKDSVEPPNKNVENKNDIEVADKKTTFTPVEFAYKSTTLTPKTCAYLDSIAQMLKNSGARIKLIGHTDNIGSYGFNINLSRNRAKVVMEYLVKQGVARDKITTEGFGSNRPAADNTTEQGRAKNRRVDLEISE